MFINNVLFTLFFPLFCGFFIMIFGNKIGFLKSSLIFIFMYSISVILLAWQYIYILKTHVVIQINLFNIVAFENFSINFSFFFDLFTISMMFVVVFISFLVTNFSLWYMKGDPSHLKFINYLNFFSFFMLILVCSNSLIIIFIGWEGIGIFSYLLINFWSTRLNANRSALKAIVINKIGDCFIYLFMFIYFFIFDSFTINDSKTLVFSQSFDNLPTTDYKLQNFLTVLLIVAAMAKSAQIFFHIWLPDAMEGPTPVSALLHAATMVTAGAYILIKFSWIALYTEKLFFFIALVGVITNFVASFIAIFQYDIKKIIAYSTASQIGIIFISIGVLKPNLALFHIFNHAFFKALLFMLAGILIHSLANNQDLRSMFKIENNLFFVYACLLGGSMTLAGLPFLSSYFSKEFIIQNSFLNSALIKDFILYFLNLSIITTILYTLKIIFFIFSSDNTESMIYQYEGCNLKEIKNSIKLQKNMVEFVKELKYNITLSAYLLLILSIFSGFFFNIVFQFDFFTFNNNFSNNLNLEKSINITSFEYSSLMIFFCIFTAICFYPKLLKFFLYSLFFYQNYYVLKIFFEAKLFFESLSFYLSELFFDLRLLTKILDREVTENVFVAYWNDKVLQSYPYRKVLSTNMMLLTFFVCSNILSILIIILVPETLIMIFQFYFFIFFWDFIKFSVTRRLR